MTIHIIPSLYVIVVVCLIRPRPLSLFNIYHWVQVMSFDFHNSRHPFMPASVLMTCQLTARGVCLYEIGKEEKKRRETVAT